ncbi:2-oxoacid:acceptor oxidoreductase family protein [Halanaerobium sp. MA284_MarDTE_T2]|uniref:2-oxoacid:acceptor oxidoreductase family protein n=1 Tax=Halanaerobium sp. MA284_MarDTE_T2 TaxID=2183913 RepID=UPI000DF1A425|nr:2-oxoacid:acceptor oxidoreductase family protein [Halanaerobium sp. MA284_MarDTE_T2]RCW44390.1 2-oxoglutarate ferredoxin oxidoreductase gamma subunit [Halanaerobium sp. MA284_MarDTE_T2]
MANINIRIAGIGGQGVVLSGIILGRTASVYEGKNAVQTQSYGSSARGGDVCSEIIISNKKIIYPQVLKSDILIALSQKAVDKYRDQILEGGTLIVDKDLTKLEFETEKFKVYGESFNKTAIDEFNNKTVANMIMLGYLVKKTEIVDVELLKKSILESVPVETKEINIKALNKGMLLAQ